MKTRAARSLMGVVLAVVALGACTAGRSSGPERTGKASAAVELAPASAVCLQLQVTGGGATVTSSYDLAPETSTTFLLSGLPLATDAFSATAYPVACTEAASVIPTWMSNPVTA